MTSDASVFLSVGWPLWFTDRNMSQQLSDGSPQHFVRIWWRPDDFVDAVTFSSGNTMRFSFILWKRGTPLMSESVYRSPVVYMLMCEAFFFASRRRLTQGLMKCLKSSHFCEIKCAHLTSTARSLTLLEVIDLNIAGVWLFLSQANTETLMHATLSRKNTAT